jgi:hypothetical protein
MSQYVDAARSLRADSIFIIAIRVARGCASRILNDLTELRHVGDGQQFLLRWTIARRAETCVALVNGNQDDKTSVDALVNSLNDVSLVADGSVTQTGTRTFSSCEATEDADPVSRTIRTALRAGGERRVSLDGRDRKSEATHGGVSTHSDCRQLSASLRHDAAILRKTSCASTSSTQ